MKLDSPITELKGVVDELASKLAILGVRTVGDLIDNYPRRYDDYSNLIDVQKLKPGNVTIRAKITSIKGRYARKRLHITEAIATDGTDSVRLIWFNQPYREKNTRRDQDYYISGEFGLHGQHLSIMSPSVELVSSFPINTARIVPIYHETRGLKSNQIRKLVKQTVMNVEKLPEHLPEWILKQQGLITYPRAITEIHFPSSPRALELAKKRLAFDEVFELTLAALLNKYEVNKEKSKSIKFKKELAVSFVSSLPFKITDAQRKAAWQIYKDMGKVRPMNRLLEGDVGSGKTVVAAMAALMAMEEGFQVAFMAPTEILARQHANTLSNLLSSVGYGGQVSLLIGGLKPAAKELAQKKIATGEIKLIVGTHALISEKVDMHRLGLIIIDEQHRFGVEQRKKLQAKAGHMPHVLHMTATPIPRSLALTLYGELDISVLDEMPPGRQEIKTKIVSPNARKKLYEQIDKELAAGRQMFVVCPLITDTDFSKGLSAEEVFERLSKRDFRQRIVGLLHSKMKSVEKDQVMQDFLAKKIDILVSTTVIEVGVDVPNASIMMIEGAERFGLAQIHQLRGRVGRSGHQSYCYLVLSDTKAPSQRLRALETMSDGFKLAELDLEQRGPGSFSTGNVQTGFTTLKIARLTDAKLISSVRQVAIKFIERKEKLSKYPYLSKRVKIIREITSIN